MKHGGHSGSPSRRPPFLTPERVNLRSQTLLDAFHTADRRQRGYLPMVRVLEIYALYFNASVGMLGEPELTTFAEKYASHLPADGTLVVDYEELSRALHKRDMELMNKAQVTALRQGAAGGLNGERHATGYTAAPGIGGVTSMSPPTRIVREGERSPPYATHELAEPHYASSASPTRRPRGSMAMDFVARTPPPGSPERHMGDGGEPHSHMAMPSRPRDGWMSTNAAQDGQPSRAVGIGGGTVLDRSSDSSNTAAGGLAALLDAFAAIDDIRDGRLHPAQLLMACRMYGLEDPSTMLHAIMQDAQAPDGRVDYVAFVQQLAAQRAGASAMASIRATVLAASPKRDQS